MDMEEISRFYIDFHQQPCVFLLWQKVFLRVPHDFMMFSMGKCAKDAPKTNFLDVSLQECIL